MGGVADLLVHCFDEKKKKPLEDSFTELTHTQCLKGFS